MIRRIVVALLLLATTFAAYSPVHDAGFLSLDDKLYVTDHPRVLAGISWSGIRWAFTATDAGYWHPVTWLSYMLDMELFGLDPRGFHFTNLLVHSVNSLLLLVVLATMTGAFRRSAIASFLFAVHPLHVESVAWIAERKDVLFGLFWLLAMGAYVRYARRSSAGRYLAVIALFALGLMAKPMMVTFPFVLLLLDFWPLNRVRFRRQRPNDGAPASAYPRTPIAVGGLILEKIPLLLLSAIASAVAYLAQQKSHAVGSLDSFPLSARSANAALSYLAYLGDTVWPRHLAVIYPHARHGTSWGLAVTAGCVVLGICVVLLLAARKRPALLVGWTWFLGTLVPVIGLVQVGLQSRADRFMYVPLIGLVLMAVWGIPLPGGAWRRRNLVPGSAAAAVILVLAVMTRAQARHWRDDDTLLTHAIDVTHENWLAHRYLALSLEQRGRGGEAIAHYREIRRIKPDYLRSHADFGFALPDAAGEATDPALARFNLANALVRTGRIEEAVAEYREVLKAKPKHGLALHNLAGALKMAGRVQESIVYYREAADVLPRNADVHANFGRALFELGETELARAELREAARLNPRFLADLTERADALLAQGNAREARRWYRDALDLRPDDATLKARLETAASDPGPR